MNLHPDYLPTLLLYYEEEVMGATYFQELGKLSQSKSVREKFDKLAEVEVHAASMVVPLLHKYSLAPRSADILAELGRESVERHRDYDWPAFTAYMAKRYPGYMDDFQRLEDMAPATDRRYLRALSNHELAAIEFAHRELSGATNSVESLDDYLATPSPRSPD